MEDLEKNEEITTNPQPTPETGGKGKMKSFFQKSWYAVKRFLSAPSNVILVVYLIVLAFLIFYPLFTLIYDTFVVSSITETFFGVKYGSLTGLWWKRMFVGEMAKTYFWKPLGNTVVMSLLASIIAILYGGVVAFFITRTNMKGKKIISTIFVFPYIMPSWTLATFWKNFWQNPKIGTGVGGMMYNLFKVSVPSGIVYGLMPCAIVLGLHYAPFAYILIGGILRNMDANLEEAATILGANRAKIVWRITLPIVLPALVSTFLLTFASSMSAYAVPQYIGGDMRVLTTYMKSFIGQGYYGQGYIMGLVMIVFGVAILMINQRITGKRRSFTTVSGKSGQVSFIDLKWNKWVSCVIFCILAIFFAVVPLITFALESCCVKAGDYSTLTMQYWISRTTNEFGIKGILFESQVWRAFGNSLLLAFLCAIIAGSSGILIGYAVARKRGTLLSKGVDSLAFLPYLMPSMALGGAFLTMTFTFGLGRSFFILVLVGAVKYLPFASRSGINAMLQLSGEIEEAAVIVGVPWWKRMVRIIFPIQKSTFISGYLLPFTSCMRELSLFVLLAVGSTTLMATLLDTWLQWWPQAANALNLMIIITVLLVNFIVNKLTGASIDKGVGG